MEEVSEQNSLGNNPAAEQPRQGPSLYGESDSLRRELGRTSSLFRTPEELDEYLATEANEIHDRQFPYLTRD